MEVYPVVINITRLGLNGTHTVKHIMGIFSAFEKAKEYIDAYDFGKTYNTNFQESRTFNWGYSKSALSYDRSKLVELCVENNSCEIDKGIWDEDEETEEAYVNFLKGVNCEVEIR